jgi:biotin carboxyl carrier protein
MTRLVTANGQPGRLEINGTRLRYQREDGVQIEAEFSLERSASGEFSVLLNGRHYRVSRGPSDQVWVNGRLLTLEVFDPRDLRHGRGAITNHGRQEIAAPMPGKVIRVLVAAGDTVEEGQGLVVVEAMKMQNEMKSPKTGHVAEVRTRPAATVSAGEVLVVIE